MFYNYILYNTENGATYNGYTTDLDRRLRQHNGEIAGGARSTRKHAGSWKFLAIIGSDDFTKKNAMSLEWHVRYPTGRKPRPREFAGPAGRLRGLKMALDKFPEMNFDVTVDEKWDSNL